MVHSDLTFIPRTLGLSDLVSFTWCSNISRLAIASVRTGIRALRALKPGMVIFAVFKYNPAIGNDGCLGLQPPYDNFDDAVAELSANYAES